MRLIVITTENIVEEEAAAICLLFKEGLSALHLRKPRICETDMRKFLHEIDGEYHNRIVLHDHFSLAEEFGLKGIHLNRRNPVPVGKTGLSVSKSCHSVEELISSKEYDYLFLSPVFDSISKSGYNKAFSESELSEAGDKGIINKRIVALGGIDEEKIPLAARYGFGGVAVLGAVWGDFERNKNEKELLERFRRLQDVCSEMKIND